MAGKNNGEIRCSFCNKTQNQVKKLIAGPAGVYICDECVDICADIIEEEFEDEPISHDDKDINPFLETIKKFGIVKDNSINNSINNSIKNSNIFKSSNEFEFILTYLKKEENSKKISLNLLYQATKDGENSSDFHNKCDGKTPQLIFIKTKSANIKRNGNKKSPKRSKKKRNRKKI